MGSDEFSTPLVELASWNEIWEGVEAWLFVSKDLDIFGYEICISEFAKLLNDSL